MLGKALLTAATGMMGGETLGVEDVFSTYLYTGNGSTQTITNGIDLAGEGGAVWVKSRSGNRDHVFVDNNNVGSGFLKVNGIDGLLSSSTAVNLFNSDGFRIGNNANVNFSGDTLVSWTFRKAPKFFDIVTYTGTGSARTIAHNLGSVPGCIIVKRIDTSFDWYVYHRSLPNTSFLLLNGFVPAFNNQSQTWNATTPTSTVFSVANDNGTNASGGTYVAYLFAHDAGGFGDDGNQNVISCGSYTGNGSSTGPIINLGWEPQWLLIKCTSVSGTDWVLFDSSRGFTGGDDYRLNPNSSVTESGPGSDVAPLSTGFQLKNNNSNFNGPGETYIYIAIRRGLMKTPTAGTDVFYAELEPQTDLRQSEGVPFPPDLVNTFSRNGSDRTSTYNQFQFCDRLRGLGVVRDTYNGSATDAPVLISSSTGRENDSSFNTSFVQLKADGRNITSGTGWNSSLYGNFIYYFFRRAPGFFDIVAYTGTGSVQNVAHNLGVAPELMIIKSRSGVSNWSVYSSSLLLSENLVLNSSNPKSTGTNLWNNTAPTASVFSLSTSSGVNASGSIYIAYLFATVPGVSKVGSYTGTGTTLDIDCGFTNGARFVLIKRTDSNGEWYVWDTARGIISGSDPYLLLNSSAVEVTSTDYIDPLSSGFQISANAPAAINANGGSYIYLSVA